MTTPDRFRRRMQLQSRLRAALEQKGYQEITTFALQPAPGLDPHLEPMASTYLPLMDPRLSARTLFLHTSPEFAMKRMLCRGFKQIYQICPAFRQGELGPQHTPEFTMAEWYRAGWNWLELMDEVEKIVSALLEGIAIVHGKNIKLSPPLPRFTVAEAFHKAGVEVSAWADLNEEEYQERFDQAYVDKLEPWLADQGALFLTHFPAPLAILSRLTGGPGSTAERFELIVGGLEIANGCTELTDPKENLERINRDLEIRRLLGKTASPLPREFLNDLRNLGLPECAGVALGVDRLAMIALGADAIEDVQALPFAT